MRAAAIVLSALAMVSQASAISCTPSLDVSSDTAMSHDVASSPPKIGRLYLPQEYWQWMQEAGRDYGVDPYLIAATAAIESRFDAQAISGRGMCIGLMQLHRDTARRLGIDPWDPRDNIRGGTRVLARLLRNYGGDLRRVYYKYNATCTPAYYREVMKAWRQARRNNAD